MSDHVYVANYGASGSGTTVSVFEPGTTTANPAKTLTGLTGPAGVTVDWAGHVYATNVADGTGATAYFYNPGSTTPDFAKTMTGLSTPAGVALDSNYRVYVTNYGTGGVGTTASVFDPLLLPPGRPGKPTVRPRRGGRATIGWATATANGEAPTYVLQVSKNKRNWRTVTTTSDHSYSGRVRFARRGQLLFFRVIAHNTLGAGPASRIRRARMR